jgi:hypothetical protein
VDVAAAAHGLSEASARSDTVVTCK